ncbi:hypothetical protein [Streptomyces sp. CAI 127]|nr:hypothetical protein [Streptomyces sp. CAI 127]NUW02233.1 hypothetical protein [Streptomyces sp. CAI 127]
MHQLIASPYNGTFLIARPGSKGRLRIPRTLSEGAIPGCNNDNPYR